jgi:hypothetical protein
MLETTLHLTRSSRLWTLQLLGFEVFQVRLQKKSQFNRFYRDTQRRDFRLLEDKSFLCDLYFNIICIIGQIELLSVRKYKNEKYVSFCPNV